MKDLTLKSHDLGEDMRKERTGESDEGKRPLFNRKRPLYYQEYSSRPRYLPVDEQERSSKKRIYTNNDAD